MLVGLNVALCLQNISQGKEAPWFDVRFSHQVFLDLNPPHRQSAWVAVPGWRKCRNLEAQLVLKGLWFDPNGFVKLRLVDPEFNIIIFIKLRKGM